MPISIGQSGHVRISGIFFVFRSTAISPGIIIVELLLLLLLLLWEFFYFPHAAFLRSKRTDRAHGRPKNTKTKFTLTLELYVFFIAFSRAANDTCEPDDGTLTTVATFPTVHLLSAVGKFAGKTLSSPSAFYSCLRVCL